MDSSRRDTERSPHLGPSARYLNRELSWLEFNHRVLAMAADRTLPLLERARFLAIFSDNLDEFFQVRVALLQAELDAGVSARSVDGLSVEQQLVAIRDRVLELSAMEQEIYRKDLRPALAAAGVEICDWHQLGPREHAHLTHVFEETIFPVLTPLAVDPAHPFPYVSNLSFNLAVLARNPESGAVRFARIKVPPLLNRFLHLPDGGRLVPLEQVIAAHLPELFSGMEIVSHCPFRVTRDADLEIEREGSESLLAAVEFGVQQRRRLSDAVRIEADQQMSPEIRTLLLEELELDERCLYVRDTPLDLGALSELHALDRPDLKREAWTPRKVTALDPGGDEAGDIFARLREGDVLVHHPYDSFESSVEALLVQAASDPNVLAIKHTIYRTSGPENRIRSTLSRASLNGVQVVTLVELQARFDEEANIEWARALEEAGAHVVYGLVGLKTHGKIMLIVRREGDQIRRYSHVGTGNYNPETANHYEDVGILSADPELADDLTALFNQLTGFSREPYFRQLLVAPDGLRSALLELIREETLASDGQILIKVNSLSDPEIIDALYEASAAGVEIELLVRGICTLRPGVAGLSDRIRVRSILGRFLEHSRIYRFGSEARGCRYWIGSADLMPRNLDRRVEVVVPVREPILRERIEEILQLILEDDRLAWELRDDVWRKVPVDRDLDCQEELQRRAVART